MGLLDGLNTDEGRLGMALLAAAGPQAQPMSFGQRLSGAMGNYQAGLDQREDRKAKEEERRQRAEMLMLQVQQIKQAQAEKIAAEQKQRQMEEAYRGAFRSPVDQALAGGGGPTVANAAKLPTLAPKFDQQALIQNLLAVDPISAVKLAQPKEKELTKIESMVVDGKQRNIAFFKDGSSQILPYGVKPEIALLSLGDRTQAVNKAALTGGESWKEGLSPAGAIAAQANNIAAEGNALQKQLMNRDLQLRVEEREAKAVDRTRQQSGAVATLADSISTIDKALNHPGRETATGVSGQIDPRNYIAGTNATNFKVLLDQIGGKAFLQAFESLKGGGQITEVEGKKATDAIARLNRAQSDVEFKQALQDFRDVLDGAYARQTGKPYAPNLPQVDTNAGVPGVRFLGWEK